MSTNQPADASPTGVQLSLELILRPDVLRQEHRARIKAALRAGRLVVIRDAFLDWYAERVYAALAETSPWLPYEGADGDFHFRHHNLYVEAELPHVVRQCRAFFASDTTKSLVSDLSGRDCSAAITYSASWYQPSDYSLPHNDCSSSPPLRQVAFLWHLAKGWQAEWGGHLYWGPTQELLPPSFNTLMLFTIRRESVHFVAPVALRAGGKRLAITGWWNGSTPYPKPTARRAVGGAIEVH